MKRLTARPSVYLALALALGVALWLWSGVYGTKPQNAAVQTTIQTAGTDGADGAASGSAPQDVAQPSAATPSPASAPVTVRYVESHAVLHQQSLKITGQTDHNRIVTVRAETSGPIIMVTMEESRPVREGQVLARIALQSRQERVEEARALLEQRKMEQQAAEKLAARGFQSEIRRSETKAKMAAAEADLRAAEIDLASTSINAPLGGRIQTQSVHPGDYVQPGAPIATIVDLDPLLVRGQVAEQHFRLLKVGQPAQVRIQQDKEWRDGVITRTAPVADKATRTFEVAVEIRNRSGGLPAGMTAEISLPLQQVKAHFITSALLALDDTGAIGVKTIDAAGRVVFTPVTIIEDTPKGMWVTGLPDDVRIISIGQAYVKHGQRVEATPDNRAR